VEAGDTRTDTGHFVTPGSQNHGHEAARSPEEASHGKITKDRGQLSRAADPAETGLLGRSI